MRRHRIPALVLTFASLVAAAVVGAVSIPASAGASTPSPFTAYVGVGDPATLNALATRIGTKITMASDYLDDRSWAQIDDTWDMDNWAGSGYRMIWGVPMLPVSGATLATGATGAYDQYFVKVAQDLVSRGMGNSILRLGWEFNNAGYPWYAAGQASAFVAYWRHIVTAMRSVAGSSFVFEWNPNMGDNGGTDKAMGDVAAYYPGDAYVDIVALDVYDIAWNSYPGEAAEFSSIQSRTYGLNWIASVAAQHAKPVAIAEFGLGWGDSAGNGQPYSGTGTVCGGDNPGFVRDMAAWMSQHGAVISGFWDYDHSLIDNGQHPLTAAAVTAQFGSGATTTKPSPTPTTTTTPSPTPTTKHKGHTAHLIVRSVAARPGAITVTGQLLPARAGRSVVVQTARTAHATWLTLGRARTTGNGHYHLVVRRAARARYLRVVAHIGRHAARSHPVALA